MSDDGDTAAGLVFIRRKIAADQGLHSEHIEIVSGDNVDREHLAIGAVRKADQAVGNIHRREPAEGMITRDPVEVIGIGGVVVPWASTRLLDLGMDRDQLFGVRKWQRPEQNAVHQAVNGGRRADSEGKRKNGGCGEARRFAQLAQGKMEIGACRVNERGKQWSEHGWPVNPSYHCLPYPPRGSQTYCEEFRAANQVVYGTGSGGVPFGGAPFKYAAYWVSMMPRCRASVSLAWLNW